MFRKLRTANFVLILSSLVIAYFIWLIAKMGSVEEQMLDGIPVVVNLPPFLEAEPSRKTVGIEVRYPKSQRREVHSDAFRVEININDLGPSSQIGVRDAQAITIPLTPDEVIHTSVPVTVQVQRVDPPSVNVWVKFRTVPARIVPRYVGEPMTGFRREKEIISSPERLVTGSQSRLNSLPRAQDGVAVLATSPIPLTNQRDSFSTSVMISVADGVSLVDEETHQRVPREVSFAVVQVIIKEVSTSRTITNIPIQAAPVTRNLVARIEPTSGAVTIFGPRSRVESLDPRVILLRPKNPPPEKPGDAGKIAIEARMDESVPADIKIIDVRPQVVHLRYETLPAETGTTGTAPVAPK